MILESVGGVDEDFHGLSENLIANSLDVENVHLQCDNDLVYNDELNLVAIAIKAQKWKPNNKNSICWGFFAVNDNSLIDFKNPHMLCCIICRPTRCQKVGNISKQMFVLCKGLIKYNTTNNITPMKTHIDGAHVHLIAKRKLKLIIIVAAKQLDIYHN
jgi:hypothetical protein